MTILSSLFLSVLALGASVSSAPSGDSQPFTRSLQIVLAQYSGGSLWWHAYLAPYGKKVDFCNPPAHKAHIFMHDVDSSSLKNPQYPMNQTWGDENPVPKPVEWAWNFLPSENYSIDSKRFEHKYTGANGSPGSLTVKVGKEFPFLCHDEDDKKDPLAILTSESEKCDLGGRQFHRVITCPYYIEV